MQTAYMIVRHSRKEHPTRVSVVKLGYDLTNYSYLRMNTTKPTMSEWVWTEDLEKYQPMKDAICVDVIPGRGKYTGMIGALLCEDSTGELKFYVSAGLKDEDRMKDPSYYIGKIIEFTYSDLITTKDRNPKSLLLPAYKCCRLADTPRVIL